MSRPQHPMQPVIRTNNVFRFKPNAIVRFLLDAGPNDMNKLAVMPFTREDREQFAQLIGYSIDGFAELSYVRRSLVAKADAAAAAVPKPKRKKGK